MKTNVYKRFDPQVMEREEPWVTDDALDGPLPKLCPVILTSNQDGHQAKNRKKGGGNEIKKKSSPLKLLSQSQPNFAEMILGWSPPTVPLSPSPVGQIACKHLFS
jgi:hypothetical protein